MTRHQKRGMYLAGHKGLLSGYMQENGSRYAMPNQQITRVEAATYRQFSARD